MVRRESEVYIHGEGEVMGHGSIGGMNRMGDDDGDL